MDSHTPEISQDEPDNPVNSILKSAIIAAVLVGIAVFAFLYFGRPPKECAGQVVRVNTYQMPVPTKTEEGSDLPQTINQQLLVLVQMHVQNLSDKTLTIQDIYGDLQLPDAIRRSSAAAGNDFNRLFQQYPALTPMKADPMLSDTKIGPKQSVDGLVVLDYPVVQSQYDLRRGLKMTVEFTNNTELTLQAPGGSAPQQ